MLFNSFSFLVFFPVVIIIYYLLAHRWRKLFLLAASCYFYMAFVPKYILILWFVITVDFFLGQAIQKADGKQKKVLLAASLAVNLCTLFFFKYLNFFNENISAFADFLHWNYSPEILSIALPLGLSFHIFQSLSYIIEVYRGKYPAEKNYFTYALYVMFFPQLVAGPIERPQNLMPQLKLRHEFNASMVRRGLERMLWGFFKKLVIADQIAIIVNHLYSDLPTDGPTLILLVVLFSYQLYCDFSGYSDIAIGSASVLGFTLMENFDRPYASKSVAEFWRRWHISLSSWLRDYLYYPLAIGWGKKSKWRLHASLVVTFILIGLWHGANWTFVVMGGMHGVYLVFGSATKEFRKKIQNMLGLNRVPALLGALQVMTVFFLVSVSWVFFRAKNLTQAWHIISNLGNGLENLFRFEYVRNELFRGLLPGVGNKERLIVIFSSIIALEIVQLAQERKKTIFIFDSHPAAIRYGWYYALIFTMLFFGYFGEQVFIYFQF